MNFRSLYSHGFARVAACTIPSHLADPGANAAAVLQAARACHDRGAILAVFPELCLSGYAIDDLLLQDALLDGVRRAIGELLRGSSTMRPLILVGAPLPAAGRVYNCAVAIQRGKLLGVIPKTYLPNYREFYER